MRQFANYIHITPSFRVSSVTNNTVVMKSGYTQDRLLCPSDFSPTEEVDKKAAGILYNFQVKCTVQKLTEAQKNFYANNAPVILTLLDVETVNKIIIGTPDMPAQVSFIPGVEYDQLVIEHSSKTPVL